MKLKNLIISEISALISEIIGLGLIQKSIKTFYEKSNSYKKERFFLSLLIPKFALPHSEDLLNAVL